jgi:hypothetical protein
LIKLYRGFNEKFESGKQKNKWRDTARSPRDSNPDAHCYADEWFNDIFAVRARSGTLICSSDIEQAKTYADHGCVMRIQPVNPYRLIYSSSVTDFLNYAMEVDGRRRDAMRDWLSNQNYKMIDDINLLPEEFVGEVMVDCEYYDATLMQL